MSTNGSYGTAHIAYALQGTENFKCKNSFHLLSKILSSLAETLSFLGLEGNLKTNDSGNSVSDAHVNIYSETVCDMKAV